MRELSAATGGPGSRAGHTVACHFPLVEPAGPAATGALGSRAGQVSPAGAAGQVSPAGAAGQVSSARTTARSEEIEETPR